MATFGISKANGMTAVTVSDVQDMRVGGYGVLNGSGTFALSAFIADILAYVL